MILYKLTDKSGMTMKATTWTPGETVSIDKCKRWPHLCSFGVLHAYESINLALLIFKLHCIKADRMFEVEGDVVVKDSFKVGSYELRVIKELQFPSWYDCERIRIKVTEEFARLCVNSADSAASASALSAVANLAADSATFSDAVATASATDVVAAAASAAASAADVLYKIDFVKLADQAVESVMA